LYMKIIVPMAGRGSRLRPHSLTVPKPLIPVAGKPIVHRLVRDIANVLKQPIEEIAFVLGDPAWFGDDVVKSLEELAKSLGAKPSIYRQDQPLGTWTKKVDNPEAYGVVKLNEKQEIVELVEKPETFVSDQAVIGIYYFKDVAVLKGKLQEVLEENIMNGGEYQINDGIKKMMAEGRIFKTGTVDEWMDCGNKVVTVETNGRMLQFLHDDGKEQLVADSAVLDNASIIPNVSVGAGTVIEDSTVKNSLIQSNSVIKNAQLDQAMIGNHVKYNGKFTQVSLGDYTVLE